MAERGRWDDGRPFGLKALESGLATLRRGAWMLAVASLLSAAVAWGVFHARLAGRFIARASIRVAVLEGRPVVEPEAVAARIQGMTPAGTKVRARAVGHWNVVSVDLTAGDPDAATRDLASLCQAVLDEHARVVEAALSEGARYERELVDTIARLKEEGKMAAIPSFEEKLLIYRVGRDALVSERTRIVEEPHIVSQAVPAVKAAGLTAILGAALLFFAGALRGSAVGGNG